MVPFGFRDVCLIRRREKLTSCRIGDHLPPRIIFQILIALCSGPRFLLVFLQYLVHRTVAPSTADHGEKPSQTEGRARWLAFVGVLRTFTWYVVSSLNLAS